MANAQFEALTELLRMQNGVRREAARLVLDEGLKPADAARRAGTTPKPSIAPWSVAVEASSSRSE